MSEDDNKLQVVPTPGENDFSLVQRQAAMLSSSDLVPDIYKGGTPKAIANCAIAMEMSERIGCNTLMVMQNLYLIKGKPSWSSSFIISAINSCGKFSPLRFDKTGEGDTATCTAWAYDAETKEKLKGPKVSMKMADAEGWLSKPGSKWKTMPELMLMYRSASFFGKLYAPEILNGMQTAEESLDIVATTEAAETFLEDSVVDISKDDEPETEGPVVEEEVDDDLFSEPEGIDPPSSPPANDADKLDAKDIRQIHGKMKELGIEDDLAKHEKVSEVFGYSDTIESFKNLDKGLHKILIAELKKQVEGRE